jgi:hypothetical protein
MVFSSKLLFVRELSGRNTVRQIENDY